jgi:formylmethanofuran dehydrogenase subunit E
MGNNLSKKNGASKDSQPNGSGKRNHPNPLESKLSEMVEVPEGNDFFLGPGLGFIAKDSLLRLISFHGHLTTGAFIGLQMLALARRLLGVGDSAKIHVLCETQNCLPDPFQVLPGATLGNKRLMLRDTGKVSVTITQHTLPGENAPGVRIVLDAKKTERFPKLHAWYMNTEKVPHREVIQILREAGDTVYVYKYVKVPVTGKQEKRVAICGACGEPFIQIDGGDSYCSDCAAEK